MESVRFVDCVSDGGVGERSRLRVCDSVIRRTRFSRVPVYDPSFFNEDVGSWVVLISLIGSNVRTETGRNGKNVFGSILRPSERGVRTETEE